MTINNSIFGIRADFDEDIQPSPEELAAFLDQANTEGGGELHIGDMGDYRWLLADIEAYQGHRALDKAERDVSRRAVLRVLDHTQFVSPMLLSEVELYAYHLHTLSLFEFKNPTAFIKSAEQEMKRLNPKRINDVMRLGRLQEMIAERKKILAKLVRQLMVRAYELRRIALYVRENLIRIEKLCEASVVIVAEAQIGRVKEKQLIEDVKTHFEELLKSALRDGKLSEQSLEKAKDAIELISMEMSDFFNKDSEAITKLYETIHDHVKKYAQDIATTLADLQSKKGGSVQEHLDLLGRLGQILVSLLSGFRVEIEPSQTGQIAPRETVINEKRTAMIDYLFEEVRKERRARQDRRKQPDRRKAQDPNYKGPERRSGHDRRKTGNRRRS